MRDFRLQRRFRFLSLNYVGNKEETVLRTDTTEPHNQMHQRGFQKRQYRHLRTGPNHATVCSTEEY